VRFWRDDLSQQKRCQVHLHSFELAVSKPDTVIGRVPSPYLHVGNSGYPLSRLRPKGEPIKNAIASHPRCSRALIITLAFAVNGVAFALPDEVAPDKIFADTFQIVSGTIVSRFGSPHR